MAQSNAQTVEEYLAELPPDRRETIAAVRQVILRNLPEGYEEFMDYGMVCYGIPLSRYPVTYNGHPLAYAGLASQKQYMSLYLMNVYSDPETERWFQERFQATGKRMDMGKSCLRFKKVDDLPLDLIAETIAKVPMDEYIRRYEASRRSRASRKKQP